MTTTTIRDYAFNIQPRSITVHFYNGDDFVWPENHPSFEQAKKAIKDGKTSDELRKLMDVKARVEAALAPLTSAGSNITVTRDGVFFKGEEIHMTVTDRIMAHTAEGLPVDPLVKFLDKLLTGNQSRDAVLSLYDFLEANNIPITEDGDFIVYKKVRNDYKDIHSGTMDNTPGQKLRIPAWQVEADRSKTCAKGLHVCARHYLPNFGSGYGNRVVICKVNPADVIAVPPDYNNSKMRVCAYEVVGELSDEQKADIFDNVKIVRPGDFSDTIKWDDSWGDDNEAEFGDDHDDYNNEDEYDDPYYEDDEPFDNDDDEAIQEIKYSWNAENKVFETELPLPPTPAPAVSYDVPSTEPKAERRWNKGWFNGS
ncbi:MAG: hypothetical protein ACKO0Z_07155 [Betaproteobacteria bacterium]